MGYFVRSAELELKRETMIAVLDGLIQAQGTRESFAKRAGFHVRHLYFILSRERNIGITVAKKLIAKVDLPKEERQFLLELMLQANEKHLRQLHECQPDQSPHRVKHLYDLLSRLRTQATFTSDPFLARANYAKIHREGSRFLQESNPKTSPIHYVKIALIANDAESVLNLHTSALWHATLANAIVEEEVLDPSLGKPPELYEVYLNSILAKGITFHNLGQDKKLLMACDQALSLIQEGHSSLANLKLWLPHIYRAKLIALPGIWRFHIKDARRTKDQLDATLDRGIVPSEGYAWMDVMGSTSLVRCNLKYGGRQNLIEAERIMEEHHTEVEENSKLGLLVKVSFLRAFAELRKTQGLIEEADWLLAKAIHIAMEAGLQDQTKKLTNTHLQNKLDMRPY